MNKMILTIIVATILGLVACNSEKTTMDNSKQGDKTMHVKETSESMAENAVVYYTCPMESHKHIHSQEAGKCTECSMSLVAVVEGDMNDVDFYGCPMAEHSYVRSDEPGTCAECGMTLMPLKFSI
ncbi:heavy metal-binding domain-containing protein [Candidatus Neomarinimicrobiota bacterium]